MQDDVRTVSGAGSASSATARQSDSWLTAKQARARYGGISDMTLWRWLRDPALNFPRPITINRRRFWREESLLEWERTRAPSA
jgi:predicted DNA-binding transcriptional regulator AlpA